MLYLVTGLILFIGIHLLPTSVTLRQRLERRLGEKGYKGIFSLISLAGIALIVFGFSHSAKIAVYQTQPGLRPVTIGLMAISMILFAAANMPSNIKRFIRHPMLVGLIVWAIAHLLANGDKAALVLFGSMAVYGFLGMASANYRGAQTQTHTLPLKKDVITACAGLLVYGVIIMLHKTLFGVAVL